MTYSAIDSSAGNATTASQSAFDDSFDYDGQPDAVRVQLSDADVESVIRKTVLRKKPEHESAISKCLDANQGELARHLQNTRFAANQDDDKFFVADYPLLPTRRRFWEKVLRNTDHSGTKAQLRSQLQIVFEATRQTAAASVGTVVPGTGNAVWGMQFIWPIKAEYVISYLDAGYSETIIARSKRDYAWIMARTPESLNASPSVSATSITAASASMLSIDRGASVFSA